MHPQSPLFTPILDTDIQMEEPDVNSDPPLSPLTPLEDDVQMDLDVPVAQVDNLDIQHSDSGMIVCYGFAEWKLRKYAR